MAPIFFNGDALLVTTHGPGNLHLYTYGDVPERKKVGAYYGSVHTPRSGVSNFIITYSYHHIKYAFYWDGEGKAECHVRWNSNPKTYPVAGKGWSQSSWVKMGDTEVSVLDVSPSYFSGASNAGNKVTCYLLPETLPS
ncbi:hypothetical protein JB92DRAFT_2889918 [Gautieria morchelliformis]|nr:hypothetical protein JB92DRAFT_2889918 [Gautieria morchelliformis]